MKRVLIFVLTIALGICVDEDAYNLKVKYLEDLVNLEVNKAKHYKARLNNEDLLGTSFKSEEILNFGAFDFIIVGGGSSGSVVASRLSEVESWKVLLLEAGEENDEFTDIPYVFDASGMSDRNWGYLTVPQKYGCFGRKNSQCPYIRGKILGGTGSINGLVYSRGIKADFDKWVEAGNPGWSWDDVLPYYKKIENYQSDNIDLKYRGFRGPLNVAYVKPENVLQKAFIRANEELGTPFIDDYNAEKLKGVSYIQHNIQNGRRVSGANNYVRPTWNRINFNVTLKAYVTKILINRNSKTAYGVEFVKDGKKYIATAHKEVIVSGGAANSPQLLMLSGIGPKFDLEKHGIEVMKDLPVGQFMKDHIGFLALYFRSNYVEQTLSNRQFIRQYLNGEGLYTCPSHYRSISYYNVRNSSSPRPNIEFDFAPPNLIKTPFPQFANYRDEITKYVQKIKQASAWNFQMFFLHPQSSGTLTLKSADPKDFPLIDSKIFDNPEDLEDMYQGIQVALRLAETYAGKAFDLKLDLNIPSCPSEKLKDRAFWYCVLRQLALPAFHLSSTNKMGPQHDPQAVVNHQLKVYGIRNLRVVDTSIVPSTVSGHINAQAFLIGEMGADFIKFDHLRIH